MANLYLILFFVFVVSISAGWLVYFNLQRKRGLTVRKVPKTVELSGVPRESPGVSTKPGVLALGTSEVPTKRVQEILVSSRSRPRGCPKCERRFSETYVLCPHDNTELVILDAHMKRVAIVGDTNLPTCGECGRHYNAGAKFCRKDGRELQLGLEKAVRIEVCEACGAESGLGLTQCCDSPRTFWVDASVATFTLPIFPMLVCPMCHGIHPPGAAMVCDEDGSDLLPLIQLEQTTLAPLGVGPRRKICGFCGLRYASSAHFCVKDGGPLTVLN